MNARTPGPLLERLCELTELQIEAARSLDGGRLTVLNRDRADLVFALQIALQDHHREDLLSLTPTARRLTYLERRLAAVAGTVIDILDTVLPSRPPPRYGKHGRLAGR